VLVNPLSSNFNFNVLDQAQTHPVNEGGTTSQSRQIHLEVDLVDQITVTGDLASHALVEAAGTVDFSTLPFR
jgi:hypothetical protein